MMFFVQKKMVVIALVAIANGSGADGAANTGDVMQSITTHCPTLGAVLAKAGDGIASSWKHANDKKWTQKMFGASCLGSVIRCCPCMPQQTAKLAVGCLKRFPGLWVPLSCMVHCCWKNRAMLIGIYGEKKETNADKAKKVARVALDHAKDLKKEAGKVGGSLLRGTKTAAAGAFEKAKAAVADPNQAKKEIGAWAAQAGQNAVAGVTNGIQTGFDAGKTKLTDATAKVQNAVESKIASGKAKLNAVKGTMATMCKMALPKMITENQEQKAKAEVLEANPELSKLMNKYKLAEAVKAKLAEKKEAEADEAYVAAVFDDAEKAEADEAEADE